MKLLLKIIPLLFFFVLLAAGCEVNTNINTSDEVIHGSGRIRSEVRTAAECSGIYIINQAAVYLTQDEKQSIRIEADDNILDHVITRKEDGDLVVGLEDGSYSDITLRIYVSLQTVRKLSIKGAGNIVSQDYLNCNDLDCTINGAGNINLKGTGNNLFCVINGAGNIDADKFISENCSAVVNGAGTCNVYAAEYLNASVNGVGSIYYYGNPGIIETSVTGIGKIEKR